MFVVISFCRDRVPDFRFPFRYFAFCLWCRRLANLIENFHDVACAEIAVLKESPNSHYEWIESPPVYKPPPPTISTFKPSSLPVSSSYPDIHATKLNTGKLSLDDRISKRPLPPIPRDQSVELGRHTVGRFPQSKVPSRNAAPKWISRTSGTKASLSRTGSEPNLLEDQGKERNLSSSSWQSLEALNVDTNPRKEKTGWFAYYN